MLQAERALSAAALGGRLRCGAAGQPKGFGKNWNVKNSIAFGKSTSQRIYLKQNTPKISKNYINTA